MPTVEFDFQELVKLIGKSGMKPEDIKDTVSMMGVELEEVSRERIVMEVFPNRPDLLGIEGFARALRGAIGTDAGKPKYAVKSSGITLFVESKSLEGVRPYVAAALVKRIPINEGILISIMNIQEKLHLTHGRNRRKVAIGIHDFSKVEPPFLYKGVDPEEIRFVPLDMTDSMTLSEILRKHPKGRDYAFVLEGKARYPIILDHKGRVLSFPPIINGELTRVTYSTKDLFIDITGTDELAVRQTLNMVVSALADRGGEIFSVNLTER